MGHGQKNIDTRMKSTIAHFQINQSLQMNRNSNQKEIKTCTVHMQSKKRLEKQYIMNEIQFKANMIHMVMLRVIAYRGSLASAHSRTSTRADRRATASEATHRRPRHANAAARSAAGRATVTMAAEEEEEAEAEEEEEVEEEAEVEMVGGTSACTIVSTLAAIGFEADAAAAGPMLQTQRVIDVEIGIKTKLHFF